MIKIVAIVSLMFIVNTLMAARLSCDACGRECTSACGTRRFRSCCFNYLRKKREPEFYGPVQQMKESQYRSKLPLFIEESIAVPEQWLINTMSNESRPYLAGDISENHYND